MASVKKSITLLPFTIQDRWYALPVEQVEGVTPLSPITSIPGNKSRVLLGLGYMLGQLMTVVDSGPSMNLGISRNARQAIITKHAGAYYALIAGQVGQLIVNPKVVAFKRPLVSFTTEYTDYQKKKITLIDIEKFIEEYLCPPEFHKII
jgi:chemotaxis signal transduction protein